MKDWLVDNLGLDPDFARGLQIVIAFIVILALIGIFMWVLAKIKGMRMDTGRRSRQPRLAVMDSTPIDNQRRLVLIRRDTVEHLILVGGETDIVVEQTIVRGAPVSAHPQRQPFPAPAPVQPQVAAPAQQSPAPVQSAPSPKAPAPGAPAPQRPRSPAPQQRSPAPRQAGPGPQSMASQPQGQPPQGQPASVQPSQGQQPTGSQQSKVPMPDSQPRGTGTPPPPISAKPAPQNRVGSLAQKAKTGLVGATAGALGLGPKKDPQSPNGQPSAQASAQPGGLPNTQTNTQAELRDMQPGSLDMASPSSSGPLSSGDRPQVETASAPQPTAAPNIAHSPETASEKTGKAPEIDLERAMGNAVGQESPNQKSAPEPAPAPESSAVRPPEKLSPKDELAHQLEALLNTPPLVKKSPSTTPPEATNKTPQPQSAAEPAIETAGPQQSAPPVSFDPISAPDRAPEITAQKTDEVKADAETALASTVRPPEKSPSSTADKTIPASMPAPQVEPRAEPKIPDVSAAASPGSNGLSGPPNATGAPDVASPVTSDHRPASSAPEPKLGPAGPAATGPEGTDTRVSGPESSDEKSDSIASIEEEMAKLLSELSGPPKN